MALYLISYDIDEKNNDYAELTDLLKKWKARRVLYSQFVLSSQTRNAKQIAEAVLKTLEDGDRLLITEITDNAAWVNLRVADTTFQKWVEKLARHCD